MLYDCILIIKKIIYIRKHVEYSYNYQLQLHPIKFSNHLNGIKQGRMEFFLMESSREKIMGLEGGFSWVRIMGDEIFEHSITFCWEDTSQQHTVQNIMGSRG
jgi:hypothetical protein